MADVLVLGAGMVGVSTALALQEKGYDVVLLDKSEPGQEASYGNAGIIQAEAAEPYALPRDLETLFSYALERSNDLIWKIDAALHMRKALWRYFAYSNEQLHQGIAATYSQLTASSTKDHWPLVQASEAEHLITKSGLFMLYRSQEVFKKAVVKAEALREKYHLKVRVLTGDACRLEEPVIQQTPAGMIHWQDSWSCSDPGALVKHYAELFARRGGRFFKGDAFSLQRKEGMWSCLTLEGKSLQAKQCVICLGHSSVALLEKFQYQIPMIYKRGYHGHYECDQRPKVPFLDVENGILASSMTKGVRLTSGVALVDPESAIEPLQLKRGYQKMKELLPLKQQVIEPQWFGTRPCLPDMLPLVGESLNHDGMWWHFGHGHQGFTLGPTTSRLLVEQMQGVVSPLSAHLIPRKRAWLV